LVLRLLGYDHQNPGLPLILVGPWVRFHTERSRNWLTVNLSVQGDTCPALERVDMPEDIGHILKTWSYDPQNSIRKVIDANGVEKIQVRVDQGAFQGILQMELDGRPDGRQPHNQTFILDFFKNKLQDHIDSGNSESTFTLNHEDCEEIFDESRRIYERYVFLLQIQDYSRVIRDTERNMEVFRFVNQYGETEEDRQNLERWWPYIIRIHAHAKAQIASQNEEYDSAVEIIREAREKIKNLDSSSAEEFQVEKNRSQQVLEELEEEISSRRPMSQSDKLREKLAEAVEEEDFEKAAAIRDQIRELEQT